MSEPLIRLTSKIEYSGPFFTRDPGQTLRANIRSMVERLLTEAEKAVESGSPASIRPTIYHAMQESRTAGADVIGGFVRSHMSDTPVRSKSYMTWLDQGRRAPKGQGWPPGAAKTVRGRAYRMFGKVMSQVRKIRDQQLAAELEKGLA